MQTRTSHNVTNWKLSTDQNANSATFDLLLIDADEQRALYTLRAIQSSMPVRSAQKTSGREALASFQRARFNVIVCRPHFGDIVCRHWIRMIRTGKFGYSATPVIVLCDEVELPELGPMLDDDTTLVPDADPEALMAALRAIQDGANKPTVLIVEDEILAAEAAGKALDKVYRVELAHDGTTALRVWREKRHSLVLLDLMLPDLSGKEILAAMVAENPTQVIIVLTAHDALEKHQELVLAGASDFLSKPLDMHALPEACANALRAKKCMSNVERSRTEVLAVAELAARVRAAHYHLERGQAARSNAHLRRALVASRAHQLDEDQWAKLMSEFDAP